MRVSVGFGGVVSVGFGGVAVLFGVLSTGQHPNGLVVQHRALGGEG